MTYIIQVKINKIKRLDYTYGHSKYLGFKIFYYFNSRHIHTTIYKNIKYKSIYNISMLWAL